MSNPEGILEEVRLRLIPWMNYDNGYEINNGYLHSLFGILDAYGNPSDLEILGGFKEHPDGIVKYAAENAYSRLEKRLRKESGKRTAKNFMSRNRDKKDYSTLESREESTGDLDNYKLFWWGIAGIVLAGVAGILLYKRKV